MGFSAKQLKALRRDLNPRYVRTREVQGRELSYIEGWYAIAEANRIFGFDGWSLETTDSKCVLARENRGTFITIYTAKVRISILTDTGTVVREGHGTGEGRGTSPGDVHDIALKVAETDATKRALATFGKPFGLALYRRDKAHPKKAIASDRNPVSLVPHRAGLAKFAETIASQPSASNDQQRSLDAVRAVIGQTQSTNQVSLRIDKSVLTIGTPKRLRNKAHLRFVAAQPCLICGRQPCDPHHLRFTQPRALGLKVSDEFTVPLCRGHHRQLHQAGNEVLWWADLEIDALEIAHGLWQESRANGHSDALP